MSTASGVDLAATTKAVSGPDLPTRADLDAATSATAAAIADPSSTAADIYRAALAEEAVFTAYLKRPGAEAELEAGI